MNSQQSRRPATIQTNRTYTTLITKKTDPKREDKAVIGQILNRIKRDQPDLPLMILDHHQKDAGSLYIKRQLLDQTPHAEISTIDNNSESILQAIDQANKAKKKFERVFADNKRHEEIFKNNLASPIVVKDFKKTTNQIKSFIQRELRRDKPKIWRINKFVFLRPNQNRVKTFD